MIKRTNTATAQIEALMIEAKETGETVICGEIRTQWKGVVSRGGIASTVSRLSKKMGGYWAVRAIAGNLAIIYIDAGDGDDLPI
jgi:hypothetical protein